MVAPAGCGKTEALNEARPHLGVVFNVALTTNGIPAAELGRAIVKAIAPKDVRNFGTLVDRSPPVSELITWIVRRLRSFHGTVIIDDFHRASGDEDGNTLISGVIDKTNVHLKWVIASRTNPDLPVGNWLSAGKLGMPIEEDELIFTPLEAGALAISLGLDIDDANLQTIHEDTAGWAIALRLSLDFWERTRSVQPLRLRTREVLFRYIESEIWDMLDSEDERLLLGAASLLQPIRSNILTEAGFEDVRSTLDRIRRVPLVMRSDTNKFYIHDILREFAIKRLRDRDQFTDVVRRLGKALHSYGEDADALRLFTEVGDHESTLSHLADNGLSLLDFGRGIAVTQAIKTLPKSMIIGNPVVFGLSGALDEMRGSFEAAEQQYRTALACDIPRNMRIPIAKRLATLLMNRSRARESVPILRKAIVPGISRADKTELSALLAIAYALTNDHEKSDEALISTENNVESLGPEPRARTFQFLAAASFYLNRYEEAEHFARKSAELSTSLNLHAHAARSYSVLYSITSLTAAEPATAVFAIKEWVTAAERGGDSIVHIAGLRASFITAIDCGNDAEAAIAEKLLEDLGDARSYHDTLPARIARAMSYGGKGQLQKAARVLATLLEKDLTSAERALRSAMLALIYAADRNHDTARTVLKSPALASLGEPSDLFSRRYHNLAQAYRALTLWLIENHAVARKIIALTDDVAGMAARDRTLVEVISRFVHMPTAAIDADTALEVSAPLDNLGLLGVARFIRACCTRHNEHAIKLTPSEFEVLRAFKTLSTEAEVAELLGKTKGTVHSQINSIIKKLNCSGRHEALVRARGEGWI